MVSTNTSQRSDLSVCYFFFIFFLDNKNLQENLGHNDKELTLRLNIEDSGGAVSGLHMIFKKCVGSNRAIKSLQSKSILIPVLLHLQLSSNYLLLKDCFVYIVDSSQCVFVLNVLSIFGILVGVINKQG